MANTVEYTFVAKDRFSAAAEKINRALRKMKGGLKGVNDQTKQTNTHFRQMEKSSNGMVTAAKRYLGFAATVGVARKSINSAAAAEKALNMTLSNAANEVIGRQLTPRIKEQIAVLRDLGFDIDQISRAMFKMTSQQGLTAETLDKIAGASDLAIGGYTDLELAISSTNKQLEAFRDLGGDSQRAARQIFEAQRIGDTSVEQLARFAPVSAGEAGAAGLRSAEQLAILSVFTKPMKNTATVSERLKALLAALDQGPTGKEGTRAARALSLPKNLEEFKEQGGILPFFEKVLEAQQTRRGRLQLAEFLPSIEAASLLKFVTPERLQALREGVVSIESGTNLDASVATRMASLEISMNQLSAAIDSLTAEIGAGISPMFKRFSLTFKDTMQDEGLLDSAKGRIHTPAFLGGEGGGVDSTLEIFSKALDLLVSPITAMGDAMALNPQGKATVDINVKSTGVEVDATGITADGLDVGVNEVN